jgi:carbamoyl-phosphate synthase small subunit
MENERVLVLEDGTVVRGHGFGAEGSVFGELVFNTGMTGYQEALTDPSYNGQLLMMTYPLIGNYGVNARDFESSKIQAEAFVVREHCLRPSHRDSIKTIHEFLREHNIIGISGVDTRSLTKRTRVSGTMRAGIVDPGEEERALDKVKSMPFPDAGNLAGEVATPKPVTYAPPDGSSPFVVVLDCGVKMSIIRNLNQFASVLQVPYSWKASEILEKKPHGVLISNGPGDPAHPELMRTVVRTAKELAGKVPVMGICLGHQIMGLAFGGKTFKLKFGHRGANQPVRNVSTGKVCITSQNHGFAVHPDMPSELRLMETNVNDGTVEALEHKELPMFSVQYHPEASPGPHDARHIFGKFREMIHKHRGGR